MKCWHRQHLCWFLQETAIFINFTRSTGESEPLNVSLEMRQWTTCLKESWHWATFIQLNKNFLFSLEPYLAFYVEEISLASPVSANIGCLLPWISANGHSAEQCGPNTPWLVLHGGISPQKSSNLTCFLGWWRQKGHFTQAGAIAPTPGDNLLKHGDWNNLPFYQWM